MYNTQTNYPNYMPVPTTVSLQLFFINTAQDLNLLPAVSMILLTPEISLSGMHMK